MYDIITDLIKDIGISNFKNKYLNKSYYLYLGEYGNEWLGLNSFDCINRMQIERILKKFKPCYFEDLNKFYQNRNVLKKETLINSEFNSFDFKVILICQYNIENNKFKYGLFISIEEKRLGGLL